ncbi:MAG: S8 family serine peptidase, partial [Roseimicrobium sp.]
TLVGLRLIAGNVSDADEAEALSWKNDIIHLYSNSWGPHDYGSDLVDAGPLVKQAFAMGATTGRDGRGSIWLWAAGNGGDVQDNSNYDGYANSIYTIAVAALNDTGVRSAYSEPGANVLICSPSNDIVGSHQAITTTTTNGGYTHTFGGTSSATPLAAGVVALLLQSNPNLGWRDVKEILLRSATKIDPTHADWINNGAGYHFNHDYGAGLINAQAAVNLVSTWTNLGPQISYQDAETGLAHAIPDNGTSDITHTVTVPGTVAMRVEHATVHVSATHGRRGDLEITLTSPQGTSSKLFAAHAADSKLDLDWTFSSVRHWGESAAGNWTLKVADRVVGTAGTLTGVTLTLYGSDNTPPVAPPTITSPLAASGNVQSAFLYKIVASNNPQTFSATGLPPGLRVTPHGVIHGTPTQQGVYHVGLGSTNALGTGDATLVVTIGPRLPTPPAITSSLTAQAVLNVPFVYVITATNSPTAFSATGLPLGLAIDTSTGAITGSPSQSGAYPVTLTASNADGTDTETLVLTVSNTATLLAESLDATQLIFTTGGNVPWVVPATDTHDGSDAAESGDIGDNQQSWLETTITGPAFVTFWFRLSSESGYDFFRFSIDDEELWYSDGTHAWRRLGFYVPEGTHKARWNYTKDDLYSSGFDRLWLDQVAVYGEQQLLGDALDNPNLKWLMPGAGSWVLQDRRTVDGADALISPIYLDHGRNSSIETLVMGPGTVTFSWTVSSEANQDFFRFEIDNAVQSQISGNSSGNNIPWAQKVVAVPAGLHALRWRYIKSEAVADGLDACWIDQISYTPAFATGPPYAQWLNGLFPSSQLGNGLLTGPDADYDGDGRSNLAEYAFGGSPVLPDNANATPTQTAGNDVTFHYTTTDSKTDVIVVPRLSTDLVNWANATSEMVSQAAGLTHWQVRVPQSAGKSFFQLNATLAP